MLAFSASCWPPLWHPRYCSAWPQRYRPRVLNVMQAARGDFSSEFRPVRLRNSLVVGQITVCVLLLITAAILLRGIKRIQTIDSGLSTRDNIEMVLEEKSRARVLDRLSSDPMVQILAAGVNAPVDRKPLVPVMPAK